MAPTPRYKPGLAKEPPNLITDDLSILTFKPRTTRFLNKAHPFSLCYYSALAYWTSPKFVRYYRQHGLVNMWQAPDFLISLIIWIIYLGLLVYLVRTAVFAIPKLWETKAREVVGSWEKAGTVLVLGSRNQQGALAFSEQLSLSNKADDALFICIDLYNLQWLTKGHLRLLVRNFFSTRFPIANIMVHSVTEEKKEKEKGQAVTTEEQEENTPVAKEESEQLLEDPIIRYNQLPLESNSVDAVLSCDILRSEPDEKDFHEGCLSETIRVLKPGGRAIIMTPNMFFFSKVSKKVKTYLEQTGVDFTVQKKGGYFFYDVTKPLIEKMVV